MVGSFDAAGYLRRARRLADLSQRQLADRLGVSRATVARMETGQVAVRLDTFVVVLSLAGLRLHVVDQRDEVVEPVPADVLRDNARRHFPSHLDVTPPDRPPSHRFRLPPRDRQQPKGWYTLRARRDESRARAGIPADHPTSTGERRRFEERRRALAERVRARWGVEPEPICTCEDVCFEALCVPSCDCQCEPDRGRRGRSAW
jgi:HTH-type transcriptional regulator/antitoxin HipB